MGSAESTPYTLENDEQGKFFTTSDGIKVSKIFSFELELYFVVLYLLYL